MAKYKKPNIPNSNTSTQPNKPKNAPKNDKKKVATIILAFLMILWTIGSIFGLIGGIKSVSADTIYEDYTFEGSDFTMPYLVLDDTASIYGFYTEFYLDFTISFTSSGVCSIVNDNAPNNFYFEPYTFNLGQNISLNRNVPYSNSYFSILPTDENYSSSSFVSDYLDDIFALNSDYGVAYDLVGMMGASYSYLLEVTSNFNHEIVGVSFGSQDRTLYLNNFSNVYYCNFIRYFCSNGGYLQITLPCTTYNISAFILNDYMSFVKDYILLDSRTYYFSLPSDDDGSYSAGYQKGLDDGFEDGYNKGEKVGFERGRIDGIESANDYTFLGLLGAVVDAPLQALTGLLNFDLLGFNMFNFFMAIFTLFIIIAVVKMFL